MSYFCKFCGKVLTTGDDIDRCNPICSEKNMPVFEIEQISWDTLKYQNDKLKTENDWYKEKNIEWQKKYDADTDQLRDENERLMETINLLQNWVKAYPLDVFPEPDLKLARKLLTDGGVSYDALNAYSMRHVINGVGKIIHEALEVTK